MTTEVGTFIEIDPATDIESLVLCFSPSSLPLKQRWRNNGLSADFLADYVTTFFPRVEDDPRSITRHSEVKSAVSYIANELLENAMKYSDDSVAFPITIRLHMESERLVFFETNALRPPAAEAFRGFVETLSTGDPGELYVQALERAGESEDGGSGLGLITMVNDYGAQLAWRFEDVLDGAVAVTTQVCIEV